MYSQILQTANRLYSEMDGLENALTIASNGWNDRVAESIKGNVVNNIIDKCNYVNDTMQSLGQQIDERLQRMHDLLNSANNI